MNTHHNLILERLSAPETLHLLKGKNIPFFPSVSKPHDFLVVHFLVKSVHEKGKQSTPLAKGLHQHYPMWFALTPSHAACSCYQCSLPKVSPSSLWALTALVQRADREAGTRRMLQVWLFYNLLVKLHSHIMPPDMTRLAE